MALFFSESTGGFYDSAVHGDDIPANAVSISADEHTSLMAAQSTGKIITADVSGKPIAVDPPPPSQADLNRAAQVALAAIDLASVRAIREWLAAQPNAPQSIRDHEAAAKGERSKIKHRNA